MEDVAAVLSKKEQLTLLRLLKELDQTRGRNWQEKREWPRSGETANIPAKAQHSFTSA
jgi:hypothetical protein